MASHTDEYICFLHIVNTFRVAHLHSTNEDLLSIKHKVDANSRTSDITETRNLCVIKVILLACYPLANEVAKGYSNATVRPSFRNIL